MVQESLPSSGSPSWTPEHAEPIIEIRRLCKRFRVSRSRKTSFLGFITDLFTCRGARRYIEFNALSNIDLVVKREECIGLIGQNGSGKSTLLRLMAGIMEPDSGELRVKGTTGTLIELGAGFHHDLTGRENAYINASVLGFSKREIDGMMRGIVDFSGMELFMDTPVRMYSSGMFMRLAFSIIMNIKPSILLIDEILAVGDDEFQRKCIHRIEDLHRAGTTIVVVSHNLPMIERLCDRVVLLHNGRVICSGRPREMISEYKRIQIEWRDTKLRDETSPPDGRPSNEQMRPTFRWGTGEATITKVSFHDQNGNEIHCCKTRDLLKMRIHYSAAGKVNKPVFGVGIHSDDGLLLSGPNTSHSGFAIREIEGEGAIDYVIDSIPFLPGSYYFSASIYDETCVHPFDHWERFWQLNILENDEIKDRLGIISLPSQWVFPNDEPNS